MGATEDPAAQGNAEKLPAATVPTSHSTQEREADNLGHGTEGTEAVLHTHDDPQIANPPAASAQPELRAEVAEELLGQAVQVELDGEPLIEVLEPLQQEADVEQPQVGEFEEMATDETEELPLEPEEFEEILEHEEEQVYDEEQQLEEYGLEYGQEYGQDEQDYGYDVEDPGHLEFEPDFDQLAEHDDDAKVGLADETIDGNAAAADGKTDKDVGRSADAEAISQLQDITDAENKDGEAGNTAATDNEMKQDDSKRKHRPISWNDWKGVDEKAPDVKGATADKVELPNGAKSTANDKTMPAEAKATKKRSRSRSPGKPGPTSLANGKSEQGQSESRGRSAEVDKDRGKSTERSNPTKKQQTEAGRTEPKRGSSPPRRSQLMGPGPVIRGRLVPGRGPAGPPTIMTAQGRLVALRPRPVAGAGAQLGHRQSPPAAFVGRGLVPVVPLRGGPLRAGLQPGEILVPQLAPRRASFPPGRAPPGLEPPRFLGPPGIASDMPAVRLAAPQDVRDMHIVHVPREQLRDIRTLRPVRDMRDAGVIRTAPGGPRGQPLLVKGGVPLRPAGPVLQRLGRETVPVLRDALRDAGPVRGGGPMPRHEEFRPPVPPDMHGRLQGQGRQSPVRDDRPLRSTSAPVHALRGMEDPSRNRRSATIVPGRHPLSPPRLGPPSGRHSPPRIPHHPTGPVRRPADPTGRPHSPPPKRSRHDSLPSLGMPPHRLPAPSHPTPLSPPGSHRGGQPGPGARLPPPPAQRPVHVGRVEYQGRSQIVPEEHRGRMQPGMSMDVPGGSHQRSPPRRTDHRDMDPREHERHDSFRRESKRREQDRRDSERREQERREQERRTASQRPGGSARLASTITATGRDQGRQGAARGGSSTGHRTGAHAVGSSSGAWARPQQQQQARTSQASGGRQPAGQLLTQQSSGARQPSGQLLAQQSSGGRQPAGQVLTPHGSASRQPGGGVTMMMQQQSLPGPSPQQPLPGPSPQQPLPGPPTPQQMGGMQHQMGVASLGIGLGMQQPLQGTASGLMQGSMNWSPAAALPGTGSNSTPGYSQMGGTMMGGQPNGRVASHHAGGTNQKMSGGVGRVDENENCWFYIDPQNQTQGPCSITQFRKWLSYLETEAKYEREYQQFRSVMVWKDGSNNRVSLWSLLQQQGS